MKKVWEAVRIKLVWINLKLFRTLREIVSKVNIKFFYYYF